MEKIFEIDYGLHLPCFHKMQNTLARRREDGTRCRIDRRFHGKREIYRDQRSRFFAGFGEKKTVGQSRDDAIPLRERIQCRLLQKPEFGEYEPSCSYYFLDNSPFGSFVIEAQTSAKNCNRRDMLLTGKLMAELIHPFSHPRNRNHIILFCIAE